MEGRQPGAERVLEGRQYAIERGGADATMRAIAARLWFAARNEFLNLGELLRVQPRRGDRLPCPELSGVESSTSALGDGVSLQLGECGHDGEEGRPHRAARVDTAR